MLPRHPRWRGPLLITVIVLLVTSLWVLFSSPSDAHPDPSYTSIPLKSHKETKQILELEQEEATNITRHAKALGLLKEKLLPHLRSIPPPSGKKYHTCIVLIVRNEIHIAEFLIRNILAGVQRFLVVDDDRIQDHKDMDMRPIFAPFIELGFLQVIQSDISSNEAMNDKHKFRYMRMMGEIASKECKWVSVTDSDEIWYPLDPQASEVLVKGHRNQSNQVQLPSDTSGIGHLIPLLETLDRQTGGNISQFRWPWTEPDPEMRILRGKRSLLEDYPRGCHYRRNAKVWAAVDRIDGLADHSYRPKKGFATRSFWEHQHMFLIHYQWKSIEEYLLKIEQAFTEWHRSLVFGRRKCNALTPLSGFDQKIARGRPHLIQYSEPYVHIVTSILSEWPIRVGTSWVGSIDALSIGLHGTQHWEIYMFMKWAVASRLEWDDQAYLKVNKLTLTDRYDDGLHHFLYVGFYESFRACFKTPDGDSFCTRTGTKPRSAIPVSTVPGSTKPSPTSISLSPTPHT